MEQTPAGDVLEERIPHPVSPSRAAAHTLFSMSAASESPQAMRASTPLGSPRPGQKMASTAELHTPAGLGSGSGLSKRAAASQPQPAAKKARLVFGNHAADRAASKAAKAAPAVPEVPGDHAEPPAADADAAGPSSKAVAERSASLDPIASTSLPLLYMERGDLNQQGCVQLIISPLY